MSCPGDMLEDVIQDMYGGVLKRRLTAEEFQKLVSFFETTRKDIESLLSRYDENDDARNWDDFPDYIYDDFSEEMEKKADEYLWSIDALVPEYHFCKSMERIKNVS